MIACVSASCVGAAARVRALRAAAAHGVHACSPGPRRSSDGSRSRALMQRHAPAGRPGPGVRPVRGVLPARLGGGGLHPGAAADRLPGRDPDPRRRSTGCWRGSRSGAADRVGRTCPGHPARRKLPTEARVGAREASPRGGVTVAEFVTVGRSDEVPEGEATAFAVDDARDRGRARRRSRCTRSRHLQPSPLQPRDRRRDRGHHDHVRVPRQRVRHGHRRVRRTRPPPSRSRSSGSARPTARSRSRSERPVTAPETIVVVGASLAGATAAATLRDQGFDGSVQLLGDETAAAVRAPGALEGGPARGATDRGAPRAPARVVRGPRDRAPYRYARRAAPRERPRGRPRRRRAPGLRPVVRGDRLPQPHAPGAGVLAAGDLRAAHRRPCGRDPRGGRRRRPRGVRGHGVHRRRGRRVPANPRLRRNGRGGLRDHPVSDPGPRHRAGARGDPPRSRGGDGVQRHGGERRGRRPGRGRRHERGSPDRVRPGGGRDRHGAVGGADGGHGAGPGERDPRRADARDGGPRGVRDRRRREPRPPRVRARAGGALRQRGEDGASSPPATRWAPARSSTTPTGSGPTSTTTRSRWRGSRPRGTGWWCAGPSRTVRSARSCSIAMGSSAGR